MTDGWGPTQDGLILNETSKLLVDDTAEEALCAG